MENYMDNQNPSLSDLSQSERPNPIQRLVMLFSAPSSLFPKLTGRTDWIVPLILIAILGGLFGPGGYLVGPIVAKDSYPRVLANLEKWKDQMPAAQWEEVKNQVDEGFREAREKRLKWYYPFIYIGWPLVISVVIGLLGLIAGNFLFGGKANFWIILNVVLFSAVVGALGDTVRGLLMISKNSMYVYTGLGLLKPFDDGSFLHYFLRQIDLFTVWRIILTSIGLGAVYLMKPKKFAYVLFPIWIVFILLVAFANLVAGGSITY